MWGPRIMQAIGIFFIARVIIEVGYLAIDRQFLHADGLSDAEQRR